MNWLQVIGEASKNHQEDAENLEKSGLIMFHDDGICNYGRFFELYLSHLNPENERLFQKARKKGDAKDLLANFDELVLYERANIGKNTIGSTIKTVSDLLGVKDVTNHSMRASGIQVMDQGGYDHNKITELTGIYMH